MIFFPLICTMNTFRIWQLCLFGPEPVLYGAALQQESEQ